MGLMRDIAEIIDSRKRSGDLKTLSVEDYLTMLGMAAVFSEMARSKGASGVIGLRVPRSSITGSSGISAVDTEGPRLYAGGNYQDAWESPNGWWVDEQSMMGSGFDYTSHLSSSSDAEIERIRENRLRGFAEVLEYTLEGL